MNPKTYQIIRKIHLYACLSTCSVLLMFILSSYTMIHHDLFDHSANKSVQKISLGSSEMQEADWDLLRRDYKIRGRLVNEKIDNHKAIRQYSSAASSTQLVHFINSDTVEIITNHKSKAGAFFGIHRQRGYGGGIQYNLYALLLDLTGISIILFTLTGVLMWFHLLKNHKIAWAIFILGGIYYGVVLYYLMK